MKFIYITKKQIFKISLLTFIIILLCILFLSNKVNPFHEIQTFNPINIENEINEDVTGDGKKDLLTITTNKNGKDVKITCENNTFSLASLCHDNYLCDDVKFWPIDIYISNLSRNSTPEIIVRGCKKSKAVTYIFRWFNNKFIKIFDDEKNLFGILDSNGNCTPQCYSVNSSSVSMLNSFMIIDNKLLDISSSCKTVPDIDKIQKFIDLIEITYELDEVPDIFTENINESELALLWNLDKDHNTYSFQNGFFYDENANEKGDITSLKWKLSFEKYIKEKDDSSKKQIIIYVTTTLTPEGIYKISSFYIKAN